MRAVFHKKLKGSAMLWCVILMSILALIVMVSVSVAAAYDSSVAKSVCLNQLEYDAEAALKIACSRICTDDVYSEGHSPFSQEYINGEAKVNFDGHPAMSEVSLEWNESEKTLTAVASVPDYGERSVSAVIKKTDKIVVNSVTFPIAGKKDEEGRTIEYFSSKTEFYPDYSYYTLSEDTEISMLEDFRVYYFIGTEGSDIKLSFDPAGTKFNYAYLYINLAHSQKLRIENVPPNVKLFVFTSPDDTDSDTEITISGAETVKGFINCERLTSEAEITLEMPDEKIVYVTKGYSYEFVRYKD